MVIGTTPALRKAIASRDNAALDVRTRLMGTTMADSDKTTAGSGAGSGGLDPTLTRPLHLVSRRRRGRSWMRRGARSR